MMTITDVTSKRFSEARMHQGYEMTEVDRFMAEVAEALYERDEEIANLRRQLAAAPRIAALEANTVDSRQPSPSASASASATTSSAPEHGVQKVAPQESPDSEACVSALRLLEIATANAEQLVRESKIESSALLTAARAAADQLTASSRDEAARVATELAQQQKKQEMDLHEYRSTVLGGLEEQRAALESRIHELQRVETEHLTELHSYLTEQLARVQLRSSAAGLKLNGTGPGPVAAVD